MPPSRNAPPTRHASEETLRAVAERLRENGYDANKLSKQPDGSSEDIPNQLMSIKEAAVAMGVSEGNVYARIREGGLHPVKQGRRTFFHPDQVAQEAERVRQQRRFGRPPNALAQALPIPVLAPKAPPPVPVAPPRPHPTVINYDGEIAARAVELFDENKNVREIVRELKITFELAQHLYKEWKKAGPELHIPPKWVALFRKRFDWYGQELTPETFVKALERYLNSEVERMARDRNILPKEGDPIPDKERSLIEEALRQEAEDSEEATD